MSTLRFHCLNQRPRKMKDISRYDPQRKPSPDLPGPIFSRQRETVVSHDNTIAIFVDPTYRLETMVLPYTHEPMVSFWPVPPRLCFV